MQEENIKEILKDKNKTDDFIIKNKYFVVHIIKKIYPSILKRQEKEDFIQEGLLALYKAMLDYDESKKIKFSTYAYIVIKNNLLQLIEHKQRIKRNPKETVYSLDKEISDNVTFGEITSDNMNLENMVLEKINCNYILNKLNNKLNQGHREVLNYLLENKSQAEIGRIMNVSRSRIGQKVNTIRKYTKQLCA